MIGHDWLIYLGYIPLYLVISVIFGYIPLYLVINYVMACDDMLTWADSVIVGYFRLRTTLLTIDQSRARSYCRGQLVPSMSANLNSTTNQVQVFQVK